nr:putative retrotransposon Ty1-copia subclass protein [Tanacetum cinerariifolium]
MGAAESTSRTNGTNQEEEERKQKSNTMVRAAATISTMGVAAWGISRMLSNNTDTQENESAMKIQMITEPSCVLEGKSQTSGITWSPTPRGLFKMNIDGACHPNEVYNNTYGDSVDRASGSLEDLEIIQEEDTHPSIDTSLNHKEDDLEIDESQRDIISIWDLGEPANYKTALLDPESDKWLNAMNVEMQSMKDNEVWDLVKLPSNGKTVGSKWLFKKKTDMDEAVHTYKARLVAKGYTQTPGIDYEETF